MPRPDGREDEELTRPILPDGGHVVVDELGATRRLGSATARVGDSPRSDQNNGTVPHDPLVTGDYGTGGLAASEVLLAPGTMVDHFKVKRLLGRGAMGEVYLARDTKLGRKVALKLVHPELLGSSKSVERFLLEAKITAKFDHPHIVAIYDVGEHRSRPYVALAYLEGEDLRTRVRRRKPTVQESLRYGLAVAEALEEAHSHGVLHRDLKPANVVVPRDGRPRVVDFGLAMAVRREERPPLSTTATVEGPPSVAATEMVAALQAAREETAWSAGTPAYMAPEQWLEQPCQPATDIWALGVMLFELCLGKRPFAGQSMADLATEVCSVSTAPSLLSLESVPAELSRLVDSCLLKAPAARPSAADVVRELRGLLQPHREGAAASKNPFRGLFAFTERDAAVFHGRELETAAFVERLREQTVMTVVGPSGAGKSSFVQAGVIPRLREQGPCVVLRMRPGFQPLRALAARFRRRDASEDGESTADPDFTGSEPESRPVASGDPTRADALAEELRQEPQQLGLLLRSLAEESKASVVLVVDQLEELFTLTEDEQSRVAFLDAISSGADDPAEPVRVIVCVRDDFLGRMSISSATRDTFAQVTVLERLDDQRLQAVLERPLATVGYAFEDPATPGEMVSAVHGSSTGLPLLQFAAAKLWERRDEKRRLLLQTAYEEMGGVEGALAQHADGVLRGLSSTASPLARQLLLRLVTPERTRRVVSRGDALQGLSKDAAYVLRQLTQARLVAISKTTASATHSATVELAHESLIHEWKTLAGWIDDSREDLAFWSEVEQAAELWSKRGRRPAELWQGASLQEALSRRPVDPPRDLVLAFLEAGRRRQRDISWKRRLLVATVSCVVIGVGMGAWYYRGHMAEQARLQQEASLRTEAVAEVDRFLAATARGGMGARWLETYTLKMIALDEPAVRTVLEDRLIESLHHDSVDVRLLSARALAGLRSRRAVEPLSELLAENAEPTEDVRIEAINALGVIGDARAELPVRAARRRSGLNSRLWQQTELAFRMIPLPAVPPEGLSAEAWADRGRALLNKRDRSGALDALSRAIEIEPKLGRAFNNRAIVHRQQGDMELARADYEQAIALDPTDMKALHNLALTLRDLEQYDQSLTLFDRVVSSGQIAVSALRSRASVRRRTGDFEGGLADLNQALALAPDDPLTHSALCGTLTVMERWEEALRAADRALVLRETYNLARWRRAKIHMIRGDDEAATRDMDRGLSIEPGNDDMRQLRAAHRALQGDFPGALLDLNYCIERACSSRHDRAGVPLVRRGVIYHASLHDFDRALEDVDKGAVLVRLPDRPVRFGVIAIALALRAGQKTDAKNRVKGLTEPRKGLWRHRLVEVVRGERSAESIATETILPSRRCLLWLAAGVRAELDANPARAREHYAAAAAIPGPGDLACLLGQISHPILE